ITGSAGETAIISSAVTSSAASFATESAGLSDIVSSSEHGLSSQLDNLRWNDPCIFVWKIEALSKVIRVHLNDLRSCHFRHLPAFEAQCFSRREMKLSETSLELVVCTEQQSDLMILSGLH
ncbi:hypothetical protein AKJ16_DCAP26089, partial [Drosera capensis]